MAASHTSQRTKPVDVTYACDVIAGLCNVDAYDTLINERGWSPDRIEAWWRDALVRLILG